jgi:hypothetical protein
VVSAEGRPNLLAIRPLGRRPPVPDTPVVRARSLSRGTTSGLQARSRLGSFSYKSHFSDTTIPCAEATFSKAGDPRYFWTEYIKSHSEDISLTWFDIGEPLLIHSQPNQIPATSDLGAQRQHQSLHLKIGIHEGSCLAVTLNDQQDYFGQTVNIASRVQGLAASRAIVVTEQVVENTRASMLLESTGLKPTLRRATLSGIADEMSVYEIT